MTKYKVIRSYEFHEPCEEKLEEAFSEGWQFVRASEYIPPYQYNDKIVRRGYIEYILSKEIEPEIRIDYDPTAVTKAIQILEEGELNPCVEEDVKAAKMAINALRTINQPAIFTDINGNKHTLNIQPIEEK